MSKLTIEINTDNEAFYGASWLLAIKQTLLGEVVSLVRDMSHSHCAPKTGSVGSIHDNNGNHVGWVEYIKD